jgi:RNA polymerase sigma factor (sigma-70 family)
MDRLRISKTEQQFLDRMDVSDRVEAHESAALARADVNRLLMDLPVDQREVLVLHRLHGFSHSEIAAMVGTTEAGVRQKSYRALKTLRARVGATEAGE